MYTPAIRRRLPGLALLLLLAFATVVPYAAAIPPVPIEHVLVRKLLAAIQLGDRSAFAEDGDSTFQAAMTEAVFKQVCVTYQGILKADYELSYLTNLNQGGHHVYLWKLDPAGDADDTLVKLSLKDGKITGFWLQ